MSVNGMNVGTDYTFSYFSGQTGQLVNFGDVQNVNVTAQKHNIATRPYNAVPRFGYVPDGFKIDFTITRAVSLLEDISIAYSQAFNVGAVIQPGFLNETILNNDGTVSRYQYTNCVVFVTHHGDISREKTVTIRVEGMASDKISIA